MKEKSDLIIYKASAGSGKTYALAKEYLKILIQNPYDYNKILAVTFTKKATAEMKTRIIEYLSLLEKKDEKVNALRQSIKDEIKETSGNDVSSVFDKHVRIALQLILHDYSHFNISTIDSFFQSIIRAYAKELDLPVGMEVELDTEHVIEQAVQAMLKEYKTDKDAFSRWIEEYVFDLIEEDKSWKIERNISKLAKELLNEDYRLLATESQQQFDIESYKNALKELKQIVFNYRKKSDDLIKQFEQKVAQENIDLTVFKGKSTIHSFVKKTKNYEPEFTATLQKMINTDEILSAENAKNNSLKLQYENAWSTIVKPFLLNVLEHQQTNEKEYNAAEIVLKNIYSLALLEFINTKIKEYKSDKNLILISDANQIVSLIAQHEEVPFIFEKSASFLKYILIDEFQDTSTLQWHGMLPLLLELLQNINGLVLIVGDPKQSIYRWRGGKMELMMDGMAPDLSYHWQYRKNITLTHNYRSAKEIIAFNNAFFSTLKDNIQLDNKLFEQVLADVQQEVVKSDETGFVQCKWLEKDVDEDMQLQEILNIIHTLAASKKYSDIAILTRNNIHGAAVANFLQENAIPVVSAESLLLELQPKIKLLIAALEYVLHSEENFYAVKLNFLLAKFTQQENPEQYLQIQTQAYWFEEKIALLQKNKISALSSVAVNELVFQIIHSLDLDVQNDNYLLRFQDVVYKYVQQHSTSLRDFIEYWHQQKHKLSILPPDGMNAVKIYTIHKSKGLQFPVVILPYASWSMKPKHDTAIWLRSNERPFSQLNVFPVEMTKKMENSLFEAAYKKEIELNYIDNINLLYVAFTRAEEQLYILSTAEKEDKKEALPQNVSRLLKSTLQSMDLQKSSFEDNEFSFGKRNDTASKETTAIPVITLQTHLYKDFKETLPLATKKEYNEAQVKGTILHDILSKVKQKNQLTKAIATTINDTDNYYQNAAQRVLDFFENQNWFAEKWQQISERSVLYNGEILRADNILLSDDECIIIDYKTGAKENTHTQQLQKYKDAYSSLMKQKVKAFLLYTDSLELQEI